MKNTYAIITGGSSGIGFAYAEEWARKGYNILIVSNREDLNAEAQNRLQPQFPEQRILTRYQDLTAENAAQELFDYCESENLIVEVLVNNAGMFYFGAAVDKPMALSHKMTMLHCTTPADLCVLFGQKMKERGCGYILNCQLHHRLHGIPDHRGLSGFQVVSAEVFQRLTPRVEPSRGEGLLRLSRCGRYRSLQPSGQDAETFSRHRHHVGSRTNRQTRCPRHVTWPESQNPGSHQLLLPADVLPAARICCGYGEEKVCVTYLVTVLYHLTVIFVFLQLEI